MDALARPLSRAPAWIFLASCGLLATALGGIALWHERAQMPANSGKARFDLKGLAEATPVQEAAPTPEPAKVAAAPKKSAEKPAAARPTQVARAGEKAAAEAAAQKPPVSSTPPSPPPTQPAPPATTSPLAQAPPSPPAAPLKPVAADSKLQSTAPVPGESQYGNRLTGKLVIAGLAVPLPPGEWRVVADIPLSSARDMALVRESDGVVAGLVIASTNWSGNGIGFTKSAYCGRSALRIVVEKAEDFGDQACWSATAIVLKSLLALQPRTSVGKALMGEMGGRFQTIRGDTIVDTAFLLSNLNRRALVLYYFNPEVDGIEPRTSERMEDSEWHFKNIQQHPDKIRYLRERMVWASKTFLEFKQAFATWN